MSLCVDSNSCDVGASSLLRDNRLVEVPGDPRLAWEVTASGVGNVSNGAESYRCFTAPEKSAESNGDWALGEVFWYVSEETSE